MFVTYAFFFIPYLIYRYNKYVVGHSWYGSSAFRFNTRYREFCLLMVELYAWVPFVILLLSFAFSDGIHNRVGG